MKNKICFVILMSTFIVSLGFLMPPQASASILVEVNGELLSFDQQPVMENNRVLVPVRALFEKLGASVEWIGERRQVISKKDNDTIALKIGSKQMLKNNWPVTLDVAPKLLNNRTLVPVRAVSEGYDAYVDWDGNLQKVTVTKKAGTSPVATEAYRVFELTNQEREKQGLSKLVWDDALAQVALVHSKDMNDRKFFDHNNPDGKSPFDRMKQAGLQYRRAAENIAAGQTSPEEVVAGWMNSPGHRANILNPDLKLLGVGYYKGNGPYRTYWTQNFMTK